MQRRRKEFEVIYYCKTSVPKESLKFRRGHGPPLLLPMLLHQPKVQTLLKCEITTKKLMTLKSIMPLAQAIMILLGIIIQKVYKIIAI